MKYLRIVHYDWYLEWDTTRDFSSRYSDSCATKHI